MKTPLYDRHVASGARMAPFAGWDMPIQYEGILAEHRHTRREVSIFDTCHMGEFELRGPTALADLERLFTARVATLTAGRCRYGYLLNETGGVVDDLTCYRYGPERFGLVVNAGTCAADAAWVREHLSAGTDFEDRSAATAKLDVQGPASRKALARAFGEPVPELRYFGFVETTLGGVPVTLSRTGYTGEWGYELYFPAGHAVDFWTRLVEQGGVRPAGLGARDTLRMEMGYPLYGHELTADRTPAGAARGSFLDFEKDFIGRDAVRAAMEPASAERLVGLRLAGRRAARPPAAVFAGGQQVGRVTSGSFAPSLDVAAALAYVDAPHAEPGTAVEVEVGRGREAAEVDALPLYRDGTARKAG